MASHQSFRFLVLSFAVVFFSPVGKLALAQKTDQEIGGLWQGSLKVTGMELRILFKITKGPQGNYTAKMDSIDQGVKDIPVDQVTVTGTTVRLDAKSIGGLFEGKLNDEATQMEGEWKQGGASLPLIMKRVDKAPEVKRPQEPKKPYPYREEEVTYENARAGVKLAGALTLPSSKGPFPAAILITGSGAQDRDETVFGHRPFLVLSDYLTRRGIAVLRVDDRGVGRSTGDMSKATTVDFASDVLAGIKYLKGRQEIDGKKIGLIGHSEGGLIAPLIAAQSRDVSFVVLVAGPGVPGEKILYAQGALITRAVGADEKAVAKERALQKSIFAIVKRERNEKAAEEQLREVFKQTLQGMSEEERKAIGDPEVLIKGQIGMVLSPWFRYFLTYDPAPMLKKVKCPVLAVNGEKDTQVPPRENLAAIQAALKAGHNKDYTTLELKGLNHLLQKCRTGSPTEYGGIEETMNPVALKAIGDWIVKRTSHRCARIVFLIHPNCYVGSWPDGGEKYRPYWQREREVEAKWKRGIDGLGEKEFLVMFAMQAANPQHPVGVLAKYAEERLGKRFLAVTSGGNFDSTSFKAWTEEFKDAIMQRGFSYDPKTIRCEGWGESFDGCVAGFSAFLSRTLQLATPVDVLFDLAVPDMPFLVTARLVERVRLPEKQLRLFLFEDARRRPIGLFMPEICADGMKAYRIAVTADPDRLHVYNKQGKRVELSASPDALALRTSDGVEVSLRQDVPQPFFGGQLEGPLFFVGEGVSLKETRKVLVGARITEKTR